MAKAEKRYYWIRLMTDFFDDKKIKKLRRSKHGDISTVIYLKMMLKSANTNGSLFFEGIEDDFAGEIALDLEEDEEIVRDTIDLMFKSKLIEKVSETEYHLLQVSSLVGSETEKAAEMRERRSNKNQAEHEEMEQNEMSVPTMLSEEEQCYNNVPTMFSDEEQCSTENRRIENRRVENIREDIEETRLEKDYEQNSQPSVTEEKNCELITDFDCQKIINLFNKKCPSLEKAVNLTNARKDKIRYILAKYDIYQIEKAFEKAEGSPFLTGKISNKFKANIDFILTTGHFVKVLSGFYDQYTGRDSPGNSQADDSDEWKQMAEAWANS